MAPSIISDEEKEQMKRRYAIAALVLFVGLTTTSQGKAANEEIAEKKALAPGNYCDEKFPGHRFANARYSSPDAFKR
jgi:hypothetical protein